MAQSWGRKHIVAGDEIVVTWLEHHANIVPWQQLAQEKGAVLRVVPVDDTGQVLLEAYERLLGPKTRFVALAHVSNALGTILPVRLSLAERGPGSKQGCRSSTMKSWLARRRELTRAAP